MIIKNVSRFLTYWTTVVVFVSLIIGCTETQMTYFPLEAGRHWQYRIEKTTMDGKITQKYLLETTEPQQWDGVVVSAKQTLDGHQYFFRADDQGVKRIAYRPKDAQKIQPQIPTLRILPADIRVGSAWQQPIKTSALESSGPPWESRFRVDAAVPMDYVIESIDDVVRVSAGEFKGCVRVFGSGETTTSVGSYIGQITIRVEVTRWYAPNLGLVRSQRIEHSDAAPLDSGMIEMELESY